MARPTLVVATTSQYKAQEIAAILGDLPIQVLTLQDVPPYPAPNEDTGTFEGNARKKAVYYSTRYAPWVLADDSGLEVEALGGLPGVDSATFAGVPRDDAANNALLLQKLREVPPHGRNARFRCYMVLAKGGVVGAEASGVVEGAIVERPRGTSGFGYDPLFVPTGANQTLAELSREEKNRVSHRARACVAVSGYIQKLVLDGGV